MSENFKYAMTITLPYGNCVSFVRRKEKPLLYLKITPDS